MYVEVQTLKLATSWLLTSPAGWQTQKMANVHLGLRTDWTAKSEDARVCTVNSCLPKLRAVDQVLTRAAERRDERGRGKASGHTAIGDASKVMDSPAISIIGHTCEPAARGRVLTRSFAAGHVRLGLWRREQ